MSKRSLARAKARSVSNASPSRHSMLLRPLRPALAAPRSSASRLESSASTLPGAAGQMEREQTVIGEAVERSTSRNGEPSCQEAILPLVEKGSRLLPVPGIGEVPDAALAYFDSIGHGAGWEHRIETQSLPPAYRGIVTEENSIGSEQLAERGEYRLAHRIEAQRRAAVPPATGRSGRRRAKEGRRLRRGRSRKAVASMPSRWPAAAGEAFSPPRRIYRTIGALDKPEPDFGA